MAQWNSVGYVGVGTWLKDCKSLFEVVGLASSDGQWINTTNRLPVSIDSGATFSLGAGSTLSISGFGTGAVSAQPFGLGIAKGEVAGHSSINKFGFNPDMGGGSSLETIWDGSNLYPWITTAGTLSVTGSGGTCLVQGLDADYNEVSESITFGTTGIQTFYRVHRASVTELDSGSVNTSDIDIQRSGTTVARISAYRGQTLMALYTIPAGKTGYLNKIHFGTEEPDKKGFFFIVTRHNGDGQGVFQTKGFFGADQSVDYEYTVPLKFLEKTDIEIRADIQTSEGASAMFDLIIVDN